jgi:hypothetical protein
MGAAHTVGEFLTETFDHYVSVFQYLNARNILRLKRGLQGVEHIR